MMARLETVDAGNWREFVQAPRSVLVLGKSDCPACASWGDELERFLAADNDWRHVRFGKMLLDRGGLVEFKRANPWLADIEELPFTVIWQSGVQAKSFPGGGIDRLVSRLRSLERAPGGPGPGS
jgi:hypothetical protein